MLTGFHTEGEGGGRKFPSRNLAIENGYLVIIVVPSILAITGHKYVMLFGKFIPDCVTSNL